MTSPATQLAVLAAGTIEESIGGDLLTLSTPALFVAGIDPLAFAAMAFRHNRRLARSRHGDTAGASASWRIEGRTATLTLRLEHDGRECFRGELAFDTERDLRLLAALASEGSAYVTTINPFATAGTPPVDAILWPVPNAPLLPLFAAPVGAPS
jgi:hypothetical protein